MSATTICFVGGYFIGLAAGILVVAWNPCRFRLHKWGPWQLSTGGNAQSRFCKRCNKLQLDLFGYGITATLVKQGGISTHETPPQVV